MIHEFVASISLEEAVNIYTSLVTIVKQLLTAACLIYNVE